MTNLNAWLNIKEQQPKTHEEVIINLNGKPQIAVYGGKARDTDEYMFYSSFKLISGHSCVYASSWTCDVDMWYPLTALPDNWIELEQEQPVENKEVIIRFCGEPRIAVSAGEVLSGDELFFDFGFEYDPDFCSSHDKFMSSYSHEITYWQPLPQPPQETKQ